MSITHTLQITFDSKLHGWDYDSMGAPYPLFVNEAAYYEKGVAVVLARRTNVQVKAMHACCRCTLAIQLYFAVCACLNWILRRLQPYWSWRAFIDTWRINAPHAAHAGASSCHEAVTISHTSVTHSVTGAQHPQLAAAVRRPCPLFPPKRADRLPNVS
jgi:hypothetical protein